jgi:adenylosuccinate synthase
MNFSGNQAILIADLGYGDAGKGSLVDALARVSGAHTVIRYNGGAQAAHNVITPDGRHHTFAQFGSGMFIPGTRTHLSRFMMIQPPAMLAEERHLQAMGITDAFQRTSIDREALVTTPFQQSVNRIKEIVRGGARHGSCGMGIGETMSDWLAYGGEVLFAGDLRERQLTIKKLARLREIKLSQLEAVLEHIPQNDAIAAELRSFHDPAYIESVADIYQHFARQVEIVEPGYLGGLLNQPGVSLFEGAQGVLLDEWYGFYPYNSWSTLTYKNADILLRENHFSGETLRLGMLRGYATRHGAGPFVTEDRELTSNLQDRHNRNNPWQREFRVGVLDLVALRYALNVIGKVDGLVVTNLDRMKEIRPWRTCSRYQSSGEDVNVDDYFVMDGECARDIKVPADPTDLTRQAELTRLLFTMRPIQDPCESDVEALLDVIREALNLPILITSFGPAAQDKFPRDVYAPLMKEVMSVYL